MWNSWTTSTTSKSRYLILITRPRGKNSYAVTKMENVRAYIAGADFEAAKGVLAGAFSFPRAKLSPKAKGKLESLFKSQEKEKRQALSDGQGKKRILQDIRVYTEDELIDYYCYCGGRSPTLGSVIPDRKSVV